MDPTADNLDAPIWLDTESPTPDDAALTALDHDAPDTEPADSGEWEVARPKDLPPPPGLEDDPVFCAELGAELARRNLEIRVVAARRASTLLAMALMQATQARAELLDAVKIAQDSLWELVEARHGR